MPSKPVPNRIVSFGPHEPPRGSGTSAIASTGPPATGIFFSFPSAKNPIQRLSGDQNGPSAPSVPGIARAKSAVKGLSHSVGLASAVAATKTIDRPSGDKANWGTATVAMRGPVKEALSGGFKLKRTTSAARGAGFGRNARKSKIAIAAAASTPAPSFQE